MGFQKEDSFWYFKPNRPDLNQDSFPNWLKAAILALNNDDILFIKLHTLSLLINDWVFKFSDVISLGYFLSLKFIFKCEFYWEIWVVLNEELNVDEILHQFKTRFLRTKVIFDSFLVLIDFTWIKFWFVNCQILSFEIIELHTVLNSKLIINQNQTV